MADAHDLDFTYSLTDRVFRLSLGELADFSGAKYDGDFSLTLEQAQERKHDYIAEQLGIGRGTRVLDLGCGWGPMLADIRGRGGTGVGVTLSSAQLKACRKWGLDAHLMDALTVDRSTFGPFDNVVSLGAFEHFCSPEQHAAGRQDEIYARLFENIAGMVEPGRRIYIQTMVFGRNMIDPADVSLDAPKGSDAWYLALLRTMFPGSMLPFGAEQVIRNAQPHFELVDQQSGRLDYIQTISEWHKRFAAFSVKKTLWKATLVPRWLTSQEFRLAFTSGESPNTVTFERELLDHFRLVFERRA